LHVEPFGMGARRAGLSRDAAYLVRPDGYVALADPAASAERLERYLDGHAVRPRPPGTRPTLPRESGSAATPS